MVGDSTIGSLLYYSLDFLSFDRFANENVWHLTP